MERKFGCFVDEKRSTSRDGSRIYANECRRRRRVHVRNPRCAVAEKMGVGSIKKKKRRIKKSEKNTVRRSTQSDGILRERSRFGGEQNDVQKRFQIPPVGGGVGGIGQLARIFFIVRIYTHPIDATRYDFNSEFFFCRPDEYEYKR